MTIARRNIVDNETPGFYHCTNRCVRRTFLCGVDELTKRDYSHRKDWLENRLLELSQIFAVEIFAYAIMDNHYHIVLHLDPQAPQSWSKEQVAERWLQAYSCGLLKPELAQQRELKKQAIVADKAKIKLYRERLGSLSWFMNRLNEPLAKQSNQEDCCTGRFWEGRYSSQALLDEAAVFSCMCYVDLNPVRAKIAETLAGSNHTAIKRRLEGLASLEKNQTYLDEEITALNPSNQSQQLPMTLKNYIELVEWTGKHFLYPNKAALPANIAASLSPLNLQQTHWLKHIEDFEQHYCHAVGSAEQLEAFAKKLNQQWLKGVVAARQMFKPCAIPT